MDQLFSDVRILDLSDGIPGPFCARIFADYGADVIKVEPPKGDSTRRRGPFPGDVPDIEASALYLHLNRNKRGITLDLETDTGASLLRELVATSDIVIESFAPGHMDRLGLGFEQLRQCKTNVVLASVTPFGQEQNSPRRPPVWSSTRWATRCPWPLQPLSSQPAIRGERNT